MKIDGVHRFLIVACISGYYFIASVSSFSGFSGVGFSVFLRVLILIGAIYLLFHKRLRGTGSLGLGKIAFFGASFFWTLYSLRILNDTLLSETVLSRENWFYWIWAFGVCAVPFFSLATRHLSVSEARRAFDFLYVVCFLSCFLALMSGTTFVENVDDAEAYDSGRFRLDGLDPISLGHLSALLAIQSAWVGLSGRWWNVGWRRIVPIVGFVLGFYLMLAANSRGPMVSFFFCVFLIFIFAKYNIRLIGILLFSVFLAFIVPITQFLEEAYEVPVYSRIFAQSQLGEENSIYRLKAYEGAIGDFVGSPLVGSGLEVKETGFYPHNLIVESFMATGLLGGVSFVFMCMAGFAIALQVLRAKSSGGWISLLFLQHLIGAQFSGSLYGSAHFWIVLGVLVSFFNERTRLVR